MVKELYTELKKIRENNFLRIQEMLPDFDHLWLRDDRNNPYIAEVVIPLILKKSEIPQVYSTKAEKEQSGSVSIVRYPDRVITDSERRKLPGEDWTYLKLYSTYKQHNEIISVPLREIVHEMIETHMIDRWFYLRYADPEPHLRVRFHATHEQFQERLILRALTWSRSLVRNGLISRVCVDPYNREIERYGGPKAIDAIEKVFAVNSEAISTLIAAQHVKEITLDPIAIAVFSVDQFLQIWGFNISKRLHFTRARTSKYDSIEAFRPQRKFLCELLLPWDSSYESSTSSQREKIYKIFLNQERVVSEVATYIRELSEEGELWQTEENLVNSLVHMHINRLVAVNREQEQRIYGFWRQTLESLQRRPIVKGENRVLGF